MPKLPLLYIFHGPLEKKVVIFFILSNALEHLSFKHEWVSHAIGCYYKL